MGHIGHLKEQYGALAKRLRKGPSALLEPSDPVAWQGWKEILEILYSPEDADLAARMPLRPEPLERLSRSLAMAEEQLKVRLDAMADRGLVMDLVHPMTGAVYYLLSPPVVGFFEYSMMRAHDFVPKKRMAEALEAYMHSDPAFLNDLLGGDTAIARSVVHETAISDDPLPDVLYWERASGIVRDARAVAVSLCYCRHKAEHLGKACSVPKESCLTLNAGADYVVRRGFGRAVEKGEALEILQSSREQGLAQVCDNVAEKPIFLCNCCGCCCGLMDGIVAYGLPAVNPSGFLPRLSERACNGCSRCARACVVAAISMAPSREPGKRKAGLQPALDLDKCIGCGVCATTCAHRAIAMRRAETSRRVPAGRVEHTVRMAIDRGRLADLLVEHGRGLGNRFLHHALAAILRLPPAKRLLAAEQVQSRFVRAAVARLVDPT